MGQDSTVVTLTQQEMMHLEIILVDNDKDEALAFLRELRSKIEANSVKGMKSHLDG
jgi:lactam utilization protein B